MLVLSACGSRVKPTVNISIGSKGFSPAILNVKPGTSVMWVCTDYDSSHKIKSILFNSIELSYNQKFTHVFEARGTYEYSCAIHPEESGKIIVE
jgi:plastocyanin